ncbi:UNVERIFIED_CONTAM: uracil phosphoribosyltransferase, partial [Bifidobacterium longum]
LRGSHEPRRSRAGVAALHVTPVAPMTGNKLPSPHPFICPVLRAGLGMLDGMTRRIPTAEVGFLGMKRDEEHPTQQVTYANRLPEDLSGRQCFLIDPMLATGGTLVAATHHLAERGAKDVTAIHTIAAPAAIIYVEDHLHPPVV